MLEFVRYMFVIFIVLFTKIIENYIIFTYYIKSMIQEIILGSGPSGPYCGWTLAVEISLAKLAALLHSHYI